MPVKKILGYDRNITLGRYDVELCFHLVALFMIKGIALTMLRYLSLFSLLFASVGALDGKFLPSNTRIGFML